MTTFSLAAGRPVLADRFVARSWVADLALIAAGAVFTALLAQVVIPLYPVPITGQTLAVLLVGSTLGAARGALSMVLYALVGAAGLPVFSEGSAGWAVLAGATGGYIVGFVLAAALVGWLAERRWDRKVLAAGVAFLAGTVVTFAVGLPWLAVVTGASLEQTLAWGLYPFIPGGIIKAGLAGLLMPVAWWAAGRLRRGDGDGDTAR